MDLKSELREVFGEFDKKVNFDKVFIDVLTNSGLEEENRKNILNILIPQTVNMFDYVKEHNYEYTGVSGDAIYEVIYSKNKIKSNLGDNANGI